MTRSITAASAATILLLATAGTAQAATGGVGLTTASSETATTTTATQTVAPTTAGAVAIPAGMRTTNSVKARRYKGVTASGRAAYFARVPLKAPAEVQKAIIAANRIAGLPYRLGGGHGSFKDSAYDCSGAVSALLRGAGANVLKSPLDSSSFASWGAAGTGQWITVYTNPGHAYVEIAGIRFDTSPAGDKSGLRGPQFRSTLRDRSSFTARYFVGL